MTSPTPLALPGPLWLVGCGNMAGAMLDGWLAAGMNPAQVTVIRPSGKPVGDRVRVLTVLPEDEIPAIALLGVKPRKLGEVAPALAGVLVAETILISILAGVEQVTLRSRFAAPRNIVRAMPNLPVALNKGVTGLYGEDLEPHARALAEALMTALGTAEWLEDEQQFDVVAALAGSGPAFLYRFIDALAEAGAASGLPEDQARRLALSMVEGAATMAAAASELPRQLVERVASPGGMTRAGLNRLDAPDSGLNRLMRDTIAAAVDRARAMAEEARAAD